MRSTRSFVGVMGGLVVAGALAAVPLLRAPDALAQEAGAETEAKKHELLEDPVFEVGDVRTTDHRETIRMEMRIGMGGQVVDERNNDEEVSYKRVQQVVEVDDAGAATRVRYHYASWTRTENGTTSNDLSEATIEVTGSGATRAWKPLTDDAGWSATTRAWVQKKHGPETSEGAGGGFAATIGPGRPVAVGEEWEPDGLAIAEQFGPPGSTAADATARLARVGELNGKQVGWVEATCEIPNPTFGRLEAEWSEGGTLRMDLAGTMAIDPRAIAEEGSVKMAFDGKGTMMSRGMQLDIAMSLTGTLDVTSRVGGEIPEIAEPAEPDGE